MQCCASLFKCSRGSKQRHRLRDGSWRPTIRTRLMSAKTRPRTWLCVVSARLRMQCDRVEIQKWESPLASRCTGENISVSLSRTVPSTGPADDDMAVRKFPRAIALNDELKAAEVTLLNTEPGRSAVVTPVACARGNSSCPANREAAAAPRACVSTARRRAAGRSKCLIDSREESTRPRRALDHSDLTDTRRRRVTVERAVRASRCDL
jgi:hypothetical protein